MKQNDSKTQSIRTLKYMLIMSILSVLFSCYPTLTVNMKNTKKYPPLETNSTWVIYNKPQQIPIESEKLAEITVNCIEGVSKNCDSISIFSTVEIESKKIGGNALLIKTHKQPSLLNSNYQLNADIMKVFDFLSPPDSLYTKRIPKNTETYGKGTWDLRLSLPYINYFSLKPDGKRNISSIGFLGVLAGIDYYRSNTQYLSLFAGSGMDFFLPFPAVVDWKDGEEDYFSSVYFGITNNHRHKYFTFGYGLSYSHNLWRHVYYGDHDNDGDYDDIPPNKEYSDNTLGLMLSAYWFPKNNFSIGIIYRPDFLRLNANPILKYEHLISVDFAWKIRLKTTSRKK
ncbi:hypothetical protein AGMMS50239_02270 [Bacteroidia bacterium]|nr:hypothetical protein AGMMS50239_02270 [Bacteroidia bacterium]